MVVDAEILGYIECNTCHEPKGVKQGKGKRRNFVHGRCSCGPDNRTGKAVQDELKAFKPLDIVKAVIAGKQQAPVKPNNEQSKPNTEGINAQSPMGTKPNTDMQSKPNDESNNEPESESLNIPKCVGLGSVIGLVFGLIIR